MLANLEQLQNAWSPIEVTLSEITTYLMLDLYEYHGIVEEE